MVGLNKKGMMTMFDYYERELGILREENDELKIKNKELNDENEKLAQGIHEIYELVMLLGLLEQIKEMCDNGNIS